jgi:serine/threonine protein kinase
MTSPSNNAQAKQLVAAEFLEGVQLKNGWTIVSKAQQAVNSTGGCFSIPYVVERQIGKGKQRAFLKVLNLRRALESNDLAREMERMTTAFNFERTTLEACKDKRLRRVATLIEDGQHTLPNNPYPICYIIFELASGDIRKEIEQLTEFNLAWRLRTLHQVAVGLQQLHNNRIAHQDLKPSNVLIFEDFGAKVSDLGSADFGTHPNASPRGAFTYAGDPSYAPPELLYGELSQDWKTRRIGCDLYLLGSLIVFFFSNGASMTAVLQQHLHPSHSWAQWPHDYRTALPYVMDAFEKALNQIGQDVSDDVRRPILEIIRQLCDPDPKRRGDGSQTDNRLNLERLISRLDVLATKAAYNLLPA